MPPPKQTATGLLTQVGWETADMGGVEAARVIEAPVHTLVHPRVTA